MEKTEVLGIRKSDTDVEALITDLDAAGNTSAAEARALRRYSYRNAGARAAFQQPGGEWLFFRTPTRNLSGQGACILVGRFVYPGTPCRLELRTIHDVPQWISAKVARCRYLPGTTKVYEIGLLFDDAIDAGMFHRDATSIRVVYCGSDDTGLVRKLLADLNCDVQVVAAEDVCESGQWEFDVGLFDMDRDDSLETVRSMRPPHPSRHINAPLTFAIACAPLMS
jgi:hypothetical protein